MNHRTITAILSGALLSLPLLALTSSPAQADADGCAVGVKSDFNGDFRSDAVVADPYATVNGQAEAGQIVVMYGDADLKVGEGARAVIRQGDDNVGGVAETGDRFGTALAVADINCDGYSDLLAGTPREDISGQTDSGYVQLIWGSPGGLGNGPFSRIFTQSNFGETIVAGDQFGYAVDALEDVGQGGTPAPDAFAIAIGAPGVDVDGKNDAGWVGFVNAVDGGSISSSITQNSPGIPGAAETGDRFGASVTLNYLVGSKSTIDAAVGVPNEDIGSLSDAGAVVVVRDIYDGTDGGIGIDQNSPGVSGSAEAGDQFGRALDSIKVGSTTRLAVGISREDVGSADDAGSVQLFSSNAATLTPTDSLSQDTSGVGGVAEAGDNFGEKVVFAGPGPGVSSTRIAVSAPGEDGVASNNGLVQVFPVTNLGAESGYGQDTAGVLGSPQAGDKFGAALSVVTGAAEQVLIVGVPDDVTYSTGIVNVIPFTSGTPRAWLPGAGGIPSGGANRFGGAVASSGLQ